MSETPTDTGSTARIVRDIPVTMRLYEVEQDGQRVWIVAYVAMVDEEEVAVPLRHIFGGGDKSPEDALKFAALRSEMSL